MSESQGRRSLSNATRRSAPYALAALSLSARVRLSYYWERTASSTKCG